MTVGDFYTDTEEFEDLLDSADSNASTDWEMQFVYDIKARYKVYKDKTFLSEKQKETLEKIAKCR